MNPPPSPAATAAWSSQAERSNMALLRLMRWIAVASGRRLARAALHPITLYFLLAGGSASAASAGYLGRVFGRPPTWRERYGHIHAFAATVLDRVYLLRGDYGQFDIDVAGAEVLDQVLARGRGALLIGAHLGSFEALRALGQSRRGLRVAMCMYEQNARMINATLQAVAPEAELRVIGLGKIESMLELRDWLDGGGVVGILADRSLPQAEAAGRSRRHAIDFLGAPAAFSDGPFRLAAMLRCPVVFMAGLYRGGAHYELRFEHLADFSTDAARQDRDGAIGQALHAYVRLLERQCRDAPSNWFNFFDFWSGAAAAPAAGAAANETADPPPHALPHATPPARS